MTDPKQKDVIETFMGATIQHGPFSNRIYLMKPSPENPSELPSALIEMAKEKGYTKIFAKIPEPQKNTFLEAGFTIEAKVPRMYGNTEDALFLAYYPNDNERSAETDATELDKIEKLALSKQSNEIAGKDLPLDTIIRRCSPEDAEVMSEIYRIVFPSYPFPIDDPEYIRATMATHIEYFCVVKSGSIVALSSSEMDEEHGNVEMTDFATHPDHLGNGYAVHLLLEMEAAMRERGIHTAYTIARAVSAGMNITFAKCGYEFGGRLKNNTNISGDIESMNVWYKLL